MARSTPRPPALLLALLLPFHLSAAPGDAEFPAAAIPVSPGDGQAGTLVADTCPSFSWGAVAGAQRYELAIFDAHWNASPVYAEQLSQGHPLARIAIEAPALSWTPAGGDCLAAGGRYVWFVRARFAAGEGDWSAPRYFEIDYDADALTQTVRRELAAQLRQPAVWRDVIQAALRSNRALQLTPLAVAALTAADSTGTDPATPGAGSAPLASTAGLAPSVLATTFPNPAALKINSANGVVFNQSTTGGGIPAEGAGTRFMWYPGKAALRAGYVWGSQWDDANIGWNSTALGESTIASGENSTALGRNTTASGAYSTALGGSTTASGAYSMALGASATASGLRSRALGAFTIASGEDSTAIGVETTASGPYSTAMGAGTIAIGDFSTAMGYSTNAESAFELVIGAYDTDYRPGSTTDWVSTDRLFVIGNGTSYGGPSNALVVLKNGNVGIGTSNPGYRLELDVDSAAKPGTTTWVVASDARLKNITGPYETGLAEIVALQPVRYHYAVENARRHDPAPAYVGFIAQQAQAVFPEAVSEGADGYLDFNMHAVNVAMVNAIQTLREQNLALEAQIQAQNAAQQARNQVLQDQIQAQQEQNQVQQDQIASLTDHHATLVARLASLEAERAALAQLPVELTKLQAQIQVLQQQMPNATAPGTSPASPKSRGHGGCAVTTRRPVTVADKAGRPPGAQGTPPTPMTSRAAGF